MSTLGTITPDLISQLLGTGYDRFESSTGINGLAKEEKAGCLEILAVDATVPGTGQFREFIKQCKAEYETIIVWEIWNDIVRDALMRYGFYAHTDVLRGERLKGYRYDRRKS